MLNSFCLGLASLTYSIAYTVNIFSLVLGYPDKTEESEKLRYIYIPLISLSSIWIIFAFQFDIYKWSIFIVASKNSEASDAELERRNMIIRILMLVMQGLVLLILCVLMGG